MGRDGGRGRGGGRVGRQEWGWEEGGGGGGIGDEGGRREGRSGRQGREKGTGERGRDGDGRGEKCGPPSLKNPPPRLLYIDNEFYSVLCRIILNFHLEVCLVGVINE